MLLATVGVVTFLGIRHHNHEMQHPKDAKGELRLYYGIGKDDLKQKCPEMEPDNNVRWGRIKKALDDVKADLVVKAADQHKWENLNHADEYKLQKVVIKTAIPCADADRQKKKLEHYKEYYRKTLEIFARHELSVTYGIRKNDLKGNCDKIDRNNIVRWEKLGKALLDVKDNVNLKATDRKKWDKENHDDEFKLQRKVIELAIPCAEPDYKKDKLEYYKKMTSPPSDG